MQDEASAAFKQLSSNITDLAVVTRALQNAHVSATTAIRGATTAVLAHKTATKESADELREASYVVRLFASAHSMLGEKLREGAMSLGKFGTVLGEMGPAGIAAAGVIGLVGDRLKDSVQSYARFEAQGVRLNATLKALGEQGKISLGGLDAAAQKVSRNTLFSPDQIIQGGVEVAKVAGLTGDQIKKLLPQLADMAAYMGTSIPAAANMMTRMLQNPIMGLMYLQRVTRDVTQADREHNCRRLSLRSRCRR